MKKILLILIISVSLISFKKSINQKHLQNRNKIDYKINKENYEDRIEEGKWIAYYENGEIKLRVIYKNILLNGEWIAYYENNQIKYKEIINKWK